MTAEPPPYLFYRWEQATEPPPLPGDFRYEFWRPGLASPVPRGLSPVTGLVWFAFHTLHLFANRDYSAGLVWHDGRVVHLTLAFPGFFRFPFMAPKDLQFGALWTDPAFRGRRLAGVAVSRLVGQLAQPGRQFWYITHTDNSASQQVATRAGFKLAGRGNKEARLGFRFLGSYRMSRPAVP